MPTYLRLPFANLKQECAGVLQHGLLQRHQSTQLERSSCFVAELGSWSGQFLVHHSGLLGH